MKRYRAAIVGCGKIGSEFASDPLVKGTYTHAGAYARAPRVDLVSVCDLDAARLRACGDFWGVESRFTNVREMLETVRPDILSVCSPDATHEAMIAIALEHDVRAIVAEKPIALDPSVARNLVQMAAARGVTIIVNYTRRFAAGHARARDMIRSGVLGDVQAIAGYYTKGVRHNGTHWLDLARFFFGEAREVMATGSVADDARDPTLSMDLWFESGTRAALVGCSSNFSIFEMDVMGTQGRIRLIDSGHSVELYEVADSTHYTGYRSLRLADTWAGGIVDAMPALVDNCVACLDGMSVPVCSGEDGVAALEIAAAAEVSWERRERIAIG